jgi:hypothetical protein
MGGMTDTSVDGSTSWLDRGGESASDGHPSATGKPRSASREAGGEPGGGEPSRVTGLRNFMTGSCVMWQLQPDALPLRIVNS